MSLPFTPGQGLIVVPVKLWGPGGTLIVRLVLDTGATTTFVRQSRLERIGYTPDDSTRRRPVAMGGGIVFAPVVTLERLVALGQERAGFAVLGHTFPPDSGVDGVLGLDFLRGQRLLINFRLGLVLLD